MKTLKLICFNLTKPQISGIRINFIHKNSKKKSHIVNNLKAL